MIKQGSKKTKQDSARLTDARSNAQEKSARSAPYPFSAIVGQDEMKLALILNAVDPLIGGVLIMGHRGTGKSTAVRALADLLPHINVVSGCVFGCDPSEATQLCAECRAKAASGVKLSSHTQLVAVVDLPLGATEDRVCGTIDIERALNEGRKTFEPGLLARANRGFLYIDEVNLLDDHLVDLLLDVAASGWNKVERESVSVEHPAGFVLIGSGNPEEGELRPQLLDRFGLQVEVVTANDLDQRVAIVERREAYDRDAEAFRLSFAAETDRLRKQVTRARGSFAKVKVERTLLTGIAQLCADLKVDGHRGELTIMRAARALAAFEGRRRTTEDDVKRVAAMSLRHRLRRDVLEETAASDRIEQAFEMVVSKSSPRLRGGNMSVAGSTEDVQAQESRVARDHGRRSSSTSNFAKNSAALPSPPGVENSAIKLHLFDEVPEQRHQHMSQSRRRNWPGGRTEEGQLRGRYSRSVNFKTEGARIALDATLRAIASAASAFNASGSSLAPVASHQLRYKLFKQRQGALFVFAIDTSGSMATNRIERAKSVILGLLRRSYLNRDHVAIVSFHGTAASVGLSPSRSILRARRVLDSLSMGGSTPLSAGLECTVALVRRVGSKHGETVVLLFTDGRANVSLSGPGKTLKGGSMKRQDLIDAELKRLSVEMKKLGVRLMVVDTQRAFESSEETTRLAEMLQARFVKL